MHRFNPDNAVRLELPERYALISPVETLRIIEWKKQPEDQGPPEHERLAQEDLDAQLNGFRITDGGMLNPSHYY